MHRVRYRRLVLYDDADAFVRAGVVDVPFWVVGVGVVAAFCEEEDGEVVVCAEGRVVDGPEEVSGFVYGGAYG